MLALGLCFVVVVPVAGQWQAQAAGDTVSLSLADALARAGAQSEEVRLARSQVEMARAQVVDARAAALPQISASGVYTKTFASPFQTGTITIPDSLKFEPDSTASLEERVRYLEDRAPTAGLSGLGQLFGDLPFGRENVYTASVTGSQLLYSGGRVGAALRIARQFRESAALQLQEQEVDLGLQVSTAYHHALLAGQMQEIADAAVDQADRFLAQEQLRERAGRAAELDVLRAEVSLANLRPQAVQAKNAAELAMLELKRLVNIPLDRPLRLTTPLEVPDPEELAAPVEVVPAELDGRPAVRAAQRQVQMREQQVRVAKGAYLPSLSVRMSYGRQLYPSGLFSFDGDLRTDWTASLSLDVPVFDGLRRGAQVQEAEVQLSQARLQLAQLAESVRLQYQQARGERERAAASIGARQTTVQQAQRVYDLTVLRYDRGLATQLEVSDARLGLLQARTNLAQALSDFYIADATYRRALGESPASR